MRKRNLIAVGAVAAATIAAVPTFASGATTGRDDCRAQGNTEQQCLQDTRLVSATWTGGIPNGPSRNAEISHGGRNSRVNDPIVYESDASNIVPSDTNGVTDVFVQYRRKPFTEDGSEWVRGAVEQLRARTGRTTYVEPNGRSYDPAVDGEFNTPASCVAFVSEATNLVRGDTNGVADAFVYFLKSRRVRRVSVGSRGQQANGPSFDVDVDGDCSRVAFSSSATNLALRQRDLPRASGDVSDADLKERATRYPYAIANAARLPAGVKQVYMRQLKGEGNEELLPGMTALMSRHRSGRPGMKDSSEPSFAYRMNGQHKKLAFTSEASLDSADDNRVSDVYVRDFLPRPPKRHQTVLVSREELNGPVGNGPSRRPSASDQGLYVHYETDATNLLDRDTNGATDIARARLCEIFRGDACSDRTPTIAAQEWVSRNPDGTIGNAPSRRPAASNGGSYAVFDTLATNLKGLPNRQLEDTNGLMQDVYLHTFERRTPLLQSRYGVADPLRLRLPSTNPAISSKGNYVLFETNDPCADSTVYVNSADCRRGTASLFEAAAANPAMHQVYMRYVGPERFLYQG